MSTETILTFRAWSPALDGENMADRLELIAAQLRLGHTSGDAHGAGWWSVEGLAEESASDDGEESPTDRR